MLTEAAGIGYTTVSLDLDGDDIVANTLPLGAAWTTTLRAVFVDTDECLDHSPNDSPKDSVSNTLWAVVAVLLRKYIGKLREGQHIVIGTLSRVVDMINKVHL